MEGGGELNSIIYARGPPLNALGGRWKSINETAFALPGVYAEDLSRRKRLVSTSRRDCASAAVRAAGRADAKVRREEVSRAAWLTSP